MRFLSLVMILLSAVFFGATASAEAPFSFDATPGKLPKNVVPEHYRTHIVPDLGGFTFKGDETIRIKVKSATSRIVLNALNLTITEASLSGNGLAKLKLTPQLDADQQLLSFTLPKPLKPGSYDLVIAYGGIINAQAQGLYYDKYPTAAGEKVMLGSQMEPTDARRLLPSWDEPSFRASFELSVDVPSKFNAYSNTPVVKSDALPNDLKRVQFAPTPKMASYLVVLVAGELERSTTTQDGAEIGVVTTEGKQGSAQYTLDISKEILHFYNDYFGLPYPLPKLDQIATPGGFGGAMENWGGIVYNETAVLFDPKKSTNATRQRVYTVVAHEMAHQWFGDLVTTAWWDNLWLNEGFASWMETKATDHFNPDWDHWLAANSDRERAMALDSRKTTHPIQQPVKNESEANDAFDSITYLKGQSFLRMLETYLGAEPFRDGIRAYMKQHRYSNTTTADLWAALAKSSGKPVTRIAHEWTTQPGFPVVKVDAVCEGGKRRITLTQEQFKLDDKDAGTQIWSIPVSIGTAGGASEYVLLDKRSATLTRPGCDGALVVDPDDVGYFRVDYSPALFETLRAQFTTLPVATRLKLLSDSWALVQDERLKLTAYLDLVSKLGAEPKAALWDQVLDSFDKLNDLSRGEPVRADLHRYTVALLEPKFKTLGWDAKPGETFQDAELRNEMLDVLSANGDEAVIAEARRRFQKFLTDPSSLPSSLVDPVTSIVGQNADKATYDALLKLAANALTTEEKSRYYRALTAALDPALAKQTLALSLTDKAPPLLSARFPSQVAGQGGHVDLAWSFAKENGTALVAKIAEFARNNYFVTILGTASDAKYADELEAYTQSHLPPEAGTAARRGAEAIRLRAAQKARLLPELASALKKGG